MIRYELMQQCHVAQVAALETICFHDPWPEESIASELRNPLSLWVVAVEGDTLCGYVGSQAVLGEADMMNLAVAEGYRRRGIGQALVEFLVTELKKKGNYSLALEVRQSNTGAIALYHKLGFRQVGLRPNYYRNPKEGALILRREWSI